LVEEFGFGNSQAKRSARWCRRWQMVSLRLPVLGSAHIAESRPHASAKDRWSLVFWDASFVVDLLCRSAVN
jgi:hypothetical protein